MISPLRSATLLNETVEPVIPPNVSTASIEFGTALDASRGVSTTTIGLLLTVLLL